ncbi:MAG: membrane protein insertion efficiency factor YidD [Candidatus Cloacimonetes bacterium]|nr:membrane protein insertion efficiency factor YidD [Candidatus Cloacimonadota bacterium]
MKYILISLIKIYQNIWHPIYRGLYESKLKLRGCIFTPTCSEYSIEALKKYKFFDAIKKIKNRLRKCKSGNIGGYDPP